MILLVILSFLTWPAGHCDEAGSSCVEISCLVSEMAHIRRVMTEQASTIDQLKQIIDKQRMDSAMIEQLKQQHSEEIAQLKIKAGIRAELDTVENILIDEHKFMPVITNVVPRADDLGPLQTVVTQMGQQLTALTADNQAMKNAVQLLQNVNQQQDQNIQDARTSTFVHWGSSSCPGDSQLVYSGVVGGSYYDHRGGGTNYLCLTMSPVFGTHSLTNTYAYLYGTEYETINDGRENMDAVCAVCRVSHATTIMIPGTNVCSQGWTNQYDGYLMAQFYLQAATEFICVDSAMEARPGTDANQNGQLLYFTITQCGSLPCGPYQNNRLVTCVVCSR